MFTFSPETHFMRFRRGEKEAHDEAARWQAWKNAHVALLQAAGLPLRVLRSRRDWDYLLRYGYHCEGAYPNINFNLDDMTEAQRAAFRELLERTLTDDEKKRGSAGWHHVHPPE
jgi:hypothetical protein